MYHQLAEYLGGKEKIANLEKADLELYFIWSIGGNVYDGQSGNNQTFRNKYS
jgi:hypothetical protein